MDGWQVRVNCKGEMAVLQAELPAQPRWLPAAAEVSSAACGAISRGAPFVGILPTHAPANAYQSPTRSQKMC